jgi:hypothetical protein
LNSDFLYCYKGYLTWNNGTIFPASLFNKGLLKFIHLLGLFQLLIFQKEPQTLSLIENFCYCIQILLITCINYPAYNCFYILIILYYQCISQGLLPDAQKMFADLNFTEMLRFQIKQDELFWSSAPQKINKRKKF